MNDEEVIQLAEKLGNELEAYLMKATIHKNPSAHLAACLCLTIGELYVGVVALMNSRAQTHAPILIRTMHEALVNLKTLEKNPDYINQLAFNDAEQTLKTLQDIMSSTSFVDDGEALDFWSAQQDYHAEVMQHGKDIGIKKQLSFERYEAAGMNHSDYEVVYRSLCSFTHNSVLTLLSRYGATGHLDYTKPLPIETLKGFVKISVEMYVKAIGALHKFTDHIQADYEELCKKVDSELAKIN